MYCAENEWFSLVNFCGTEKLQKALITRFGLGFIENHLNFKASCMVHGKTIVIERSQVQVLRRSFFLFFRFMLLYAGSNSRALRSCDVEKYVFGLSDSRTDGAEKSNKISS